MRQNNEKEILSQIEENVEIFLETNLKQDTTPLVKKISNTFFLLTFRDIIANGLTKEGIILGLKANFVKNVILYYSNSKEQNKEKEKKILENY